MFDEIRSSFFGGGVSPAEVKVLNYIYGLGGRDVKDSDIRFVYDELETLLHTGETGSAVRYLGLRDSNVEQVALRLEENQ